VTSSSSTNEFSEPTFSVDVGTQRGARQGHRVRRRKGGKRLTSRVAVGLFTTAIVGAPLAAGGVHRGSLIVLMLVVGVGLACFVVGAISEHRPLRVAPVALLPAMFVVIPLLQVLPLPLALRGLLDGAGNAFLTDDDLVHRSAWPLSLDPSVTRAFVGKAAAAMAAFLCAYHLASSQTRRHTMTRVIALTAIAALVIGLGHRLLGFAKIYGAFTTIHRGLLVGPFVNPNHNAEFLEMGAFACVACAYQRASLLNRYGWLVGAIACAAGAVATFSRGAVLGVVVGMFAFTALRTLVRDKAASLSGRSSLVWSLVGVGLVGVLLLFLGAGALVERFRNDSIMGDLRVRLWGDAWKVLVAHPFGIGRGAFDRVFPIYRTLVVQFPIRFAFLENHPYQLLIDCGWVGFALLLGGLAFVVRFLIVRGRRDTIEAALLAGLLAVAAHGVADFGLETLGVALPFCAMLGTVLGRCHEEGRVLPPWASRAVLSLAAIGLLVGTSSLALASSDDFDTLLKGARTTEQVKEISLRAQRVHPTDYYYVLTYANAEPLRGAPGHSSPRLHALNRALARCPSCEDVHFSVARNLWQLRSRGQALSEWRTAVQLQPGLLPRVLTELMRLGATPEQMAAVASFDGKAMLEAANFLANGARLKDALRILDQADAMYAPKAESLITRVRLTLATGQIAAAQTALAEVHAAGVIDPRVMVFDALVGLESRGPSGADEAIATLDTAAARYPLDIEVQRRRLELVTRFEKWQIADRAIEGLKMALYHAQGQATEAHLAAARIHARLRRFTQSFNEYRIALLSTPADGGLWMEFGRTAEDAGRMPVAREAYAEASHLLPKDPNVVAALRRVDSALNVARSQEAFRDPAAADATSWRPGSP
jgi:tetratricopeptide (TPR) repeat protein